MKNSASRIMKAREFICWNPFDGITIMERRHRFKPGDRVTHRHGFMYLQDEPLMAISSANFPNVFAYNGDNRGIERGHLVHRIHKAVHDLEGVAFPEVKRELFIAKWGDFLDQFLQLLPVVHLVPFSVICEMADTLKLPKAPPLDLDQYKYLFIKAA